MLKIRELNNAFKTELRSRIYRINTELRDANMQHDCVDIRVPAAYAGNRAFSINMPIEHDGRDCRR